MQDTNAGADMLDSRDIIERIEELEAELEEDGALGTIEDNELKELKAFAEEAGEVEDWHHGAQFIHESYFEDHARQLAEDIGAIDDDARWPATCIDWKQAADELRMDYTSYDYAGETYYVR